MQQAPKLPPTMRVPNSMKKRSIAMRGNPTNPPPSAVMLFHRSISCLPPQSHRNGGGGGGGGGNKKNILRPKRTRCLSHYLLPTAMNLGYPTRTHNLYGRYFSTRNFISKQGKMISHERKQEDASLPTTTSSSTDIDTPQNKLNTFNKKEEEPRGWKLLLGEDPLPDMFKDGQEKLEEKRQRPPQNVQEVLEAFRETGRLYMSTWDGFFSNYEEKEPDETNPPKTQEEKEKEEEPLFDEKEFMERRRDIKKNVKRNVETLREEGSHVLEAAKEYTGIRDKIDLKKWAMKQLVLANECVASFMKGYRKGRDDEMDKMLHEYFQDIEDLVDDEKKKPDNASNDDNIQSTLRRNRRQGKRRKRRLPRVA